MKIVLFSSQPTASFRIFTYTLIIKRSSWKLPHDSSMTISLDIFMFCPSFHAILHLLYYHTLLFTEINSISFILYITVHVKLTSLRYLQSFISLTHNHVFKMSKRNHRNIAQLYVYVFYTFLKITWHPLYLNKRTLKLCI